MGNWDVPDCGKAATDLACTHSMTLMQDPRFERIPCSHKGTYADDCLVERVKAHRCYLVATCDRDLRRRIRKVGVREASQH
jgi:rRNA-processing protein FCF1